MLFPMLLGQIEERGFACQFESHAAAILERDFPEAVNEVIEVLSGVSVPIAEIVGSGGGETKGTQRMRRAFAERGWVKTRFEIKKTVNGVERESISHEIDHVKSFRNGVIALELEWNNKDPFFDRDLENFKRLHSERAISVGVVVTRGASLHDSMERFIQRFAAENAIGSFEDLARLNIYPTSKQRNAIERMIQPARSRSRNPLPFAEAWCRKFVSDKYGEATTHWRKLIDRVSRGVGHPCPLLLVGLPESIVSFPAMSHEDLASEVQKAALENAEEGAE